CDTCPHDWQAGGDIDQVPAATKLHRDVTLVVVHGNDAVKLAAVGPDEQRVGGPRPCDTDPFVAGGFHRRGDQALLLVAEEPAVTGVRVERRDADPRLAAVEQPGQQLIEQANLLGDRVVRQVGEAVSQGQVQGDVGHGNPAAPQDHGELA